MTTYYGGNYSQGPFIDLNIEDKGNNVFYVWAGFRVGNMTFNNYGTIFNIKLVSGGNTITLASDSFTYSGGSARYVSMKDATFTINQNSYVYAEVFCKGCLDGHSHSDYSRWNFSTAPQNLTYKNIVVAPIEMVVTPSISVNAQKGPKNIILNDSNVHVFPLTESSTSYIKQDGLNIGDTFTFDKFFYFKSKDSMSYLSSSNYHYFNSITFTSKTGANTEDWLEIHYMKNNNGNWIYYSKTKNNSLTFTCPEIDYKTGESPYSYDMKNKCIWRITAYCKGKSTGEIKSSSYIFCFAPVPGLAKKCPYWSSLDKKNKVAKVDGKWSDVVVSTATGSKSYPYELYSGLHYGIDLYLLSPANKIVGHLNSGNVFKDIDYEKYRGQNLTLVCIPYNDFYRDDKGNRGILDYTTNYLGVINSYSYNSSTIIDTPYLHVNTLPGYSEAFKIDTDNKNFIQEVILDIPKMKDNDCLVTTNDSYIYDNLITNIEYKIVDNEEDFVEDTGWKTINYPYTSGRIKLNLEDFKNMKVNQLLKFRIRAYDSYEYGHYVNILSYYTKVAPPTVPKNIKLNGLLENAKDKYIVESTTGCTWSPSESKIGGIEYTIRIVTDTKEFYYSTNETSLSFNIASSSKFYVNRGKEFKIYIQAEDRLGNTSDWVTLDKPCIRNSLPETPKYLRESRDRKLMYKKVPLVWGESYDKDKHDVTYEIEYCYNNTWIKNNIEYSSDNTIYNISDLEENSYIQFRIRAKDILGAYSDYCYMNNGLIVNKLPEHPNIILPNNSTNSNEPLILLKLFNNTKIEKTFYLRIKNKIDSDLFFKSENASNIFKKGFYTIPANSFKIISLKLSKTFFNKDDNNFSFALSIYDEFGETDYKLYTINYKQPDSKDEIKNDYISYDNCIKLYNDLAYLRTVYNLSTDEFIKQEEIISSFTWNKLIANYVDLYNEFIDYQPSNYRKKLYPPSYVTQGNIITADNYLDIKNKIKIF